MSTDPPRQPIRAVTAPHYVIGYHGCTTDVAARILSGEPFIRSRNPWDWLGQGVYFWEYAPVRALEWAVDHGRGRDACVLQARIKLGRCLNLLDTAHFGGLRRAHDHLLDTVAGASGLRNTDRGFHRLDRAVIDEYCLFVANEGGLPIETVRGCFPEGEPLFEGSKLLSLTHVQVAVRELTCISRVRLVSFR